MDIGKGKAREIKFYLRQNTVASFIGILLLYISGSTNYSFIGNLVKLGTSSIAIAAPARNI